MMKILESIKDVEKKIQNDSKVIDFELSSGEYSLTVKLKTFSIHSTSYASYPLAHLTAGSQDPNKELAQTKAIMRLYRKIEMLLYHCKEHKTYEQFFGGTSPGQERLHQVKDYCTNLPDRASTKEIPVFSELLRKRGKDWWVYSLTPENEVSNLKFIQEAKYELLNDKANQDKQWQEIQMYVTPEKVAIVQEQIQATTRSA